MIMNLMIGNLVYHIIWSSITDMIMALMTDGVNFLDASISFRLLPDISHLWHVLHFHFVFHIPIINP